MSAATDFLENEILDHILGTGSWTMPVNVFVKLHLGVPGESAASNAAVNATRQEGTFGAASGGDATTTVALTWTSVSTTETYSHWSIWDDLTAGNPLLTGALSPSVAVTAGDTFTIGIGNLTVTAA